VGGIGECALTDTRRNGVDPPEEVGQKLGELCVLRIATTHTTVDSYYLMTLNPTNDEKEINF
jgi:hypothetical protein